MNLMSKHSRLLFVAVLLMMTAVTSAGQVNTVKPGEPVERHLSGDQKFREWSHDLPTSDDVKRIKVCRMETVCKMRYREGQTPRARVRNLVTPLRHEDETAPIPEAFTRQVRHVLENLRDKHGVTVRFIGYTDDAPLTERDESTYGDHLSLSKAQAQRIAFAMQSTLGLPASVVESDGRGESRPIASNKTAQGRMLNRRIEVEFWYDDPLQTLPEEPQICPGDNQEMATKVYDPSWGSISKIELANGQPIIPPGLAGDLRRALTDIADRPNARLRFVGYTKNERLDRRSASVYGDAIGLSVARARRTMDIVMHDPLLTGAKSEHEGRGYVQSDDIVNTGFTQGDESFVRVQVVYDEPLAMDDYEGVDITRMNQELRPKSPFALDVMHITVDGKPIDDPGRSSSDIQRCTDVELDKASIQLRFDNLDSQPRLGVAADPVAVGPSADSTPPDVRFRMYTNYSSFIARSEIRIFEHDQSSQATPLAIVSVDGEELAKWQPAAELFDDPALELKYLLRVYDRKGAFDETAMRPLLLHPDRVGLATSARSDSPLSQEKAATSDTQAQSSSKPAVASDSMRASDKLLAVYGESQLALHRISVNGGTVKVQGRGIQPDHTVWVAGRHIPVDSKGNFIAEEIIPSGTQTVEVAVLDPAGNGSLYLRDLEFKRRDFFYVGMADLTLSKHSASGDINLLAANNPQEPWNSSLDGRLAFYLDGKLNERWRLTASADTGEGQVKNLFSNFMDKSPTELFRRIDPDYYYPTFGDDGVVKETAPTSGKFFVKASHDHGYGMWGNFKVSYGGSDLAKVDRGLYGGNVHYTSEATTSFGERKAAVDGFAGEPGTLPSYEQFLGTGGSLYYLHHQDILKGSETVSVEIHDKTSGIVTGVVNLKNTTDYDIDYLQGRVLLAQPLSSTADDNLLVRSSGLSGDQAYLVVRYEYTPGFDELNEIAAGGQGHFWVNDHVRLGLTANSNHGDDNSNLGAADLTLRMSSDSWFKLQAARSDGVVSSALQSGDGGYIFSSTGTQLSSDAKAGAYRADLSLGMKDLFAAGQGRVTLYTQNLDAGYSAPGQETTYDTRFYGGTLKMPITRRLSVTAKGDQKIQDLGLETRAIELNVVSKLTRKWSLSAGVRNDLRVDRSTVVVLTQEQGERTDAVTQLAFDPHTTWRSYGFVQDTVASSGSRSKNGRIGLGGSYRPMERFKIDAEVSGGDLGPGGKLGTTFLASERTRLYLNYALENERTDNGQQVRSGNLVSGAKTRLTDSSSIYVEERYQDQNSTAGLTHATGIQFAVNEHWNLGATAEIGKLHDSTTYAITNRKAGGMRLGYGGHVFQLSNAVEYRRDNVEQTDTSYIRQTTWLFRNNFKLKLTSDWRMIGKLDYSTSDSSLGDFYNGGYTEGVIGYAYRPVRNDRMNLLAKYTYFYNVPTTDQLGAQSSSSSSEFVQKSHIAALDITYDLTPRWSIGGKYAYRLGEMSLDTTELNFFDNTAQLVILRVDRRFRKDWEGMVEVRTLDLPNIKQRRSGFLAGVYRYLGKNMKVGVGYNFTDFSDNLTDLKYNHQGLFINFIGAK